MKRHSAAFLFFLGIGFLSQGISQAFAKCPDLNGVYSCGAFKTSIQQVLKDGVDTYTIRQYQQDPRSPFETGTYIADGKTYPLADSDASVSGTITASCSDDTLIVLEHESYLPYSTEKHFYWDVDQLLMQDGFNENGQFHSDEKHKVFCAKVS